MDLLTLRTWVANQFIAKSCRYSAETDQSPFNRTCSEKEEEFPDLNTHIYIIAA